MRTTLLLLILLFIFALPSHAQYRFDNPVHITTDDGLPSRHVEDFVEDEYGFIWIATRGGLCRYDGSKITLVKKTENDSTFFNSNHIRSLFLDGDTLWVGTAKGLSILNIKTRAVKNFRFISKFPGLNQNEREDDTVRDIFRDKNGDTWLIPGYNGIVKFDKKSQDFVHYPMERSSEIPKVLPIRHHTTLYKAVQDMYRDSIIWGISGADLVKFNKLTGKYTRLRFKYPKNEELEYNLNANRSLYQHTNGKLYIGTWRRGLLVYDPENHSFWAPAIHHDKTLKYPFVKRMNIGKFYYKNEQEIYVMVGTALYSFDVKDKTWDLIKENDLMSDPVIQYGISFIDSQGRIWFGENRGFYVFDPLANQFQNFNLNALNDANHKVLPRGFVANFYPGTFTVSGQFTEGLYHINPTTGKISKTQMSQSYLNETSFSSWGMTLISENELVLSTYADLYYYKKGNDEIASFKKWNIKNKFTSLKHVAIDSQNRLWVGSQNDGLWVLDLNSGKISEETISSINSAYNNLFADHLGNIWMSIANGHAVYSAIADSLFVFNFEKDSASTFKGQLTFCQCPNGEIWATGRSGGLGLLSAENPEKGLLKKVKITNGKQDFGAYRAACNSKNEVWVLGYEQILKFDKNTGQSVDYSFSYGVQNITPIFEFFADNQLLIGSREGIFMVDPNKLRKNLLLPKPYVSNIRTSKDKNYLTETLLQKNPIFLAPDENTITIDFSAINLSLPHTVQYQYMLEGVDNDWQDPGKIRSLVYSNLNGGNYKFKLRACNNEKVWTKTPYELEINVGTPWYKTTWFYIVLLLFFSALIYAFYKYRVGLIRKESKIKSEFEKRIARVEMSALRAQMNPHFIFNCLNSIENYIIKNDTVKASEYLNNFGRLVRLILNNSRSNYVNLKDELEALELYIKMEQMRLRNSFEYEIEIEESLTLENYEIPPMLIQPFVENSIWHGLINRDGNGKVKLNISNGQNVICCIIEDNGIGREAAGKINASKKVKRKSMGMSITSERIEIINKLYNIENKIKIIDLYNDKNEATGTKVIINIPL